MKNGRDRAFTAQVSSPEPRRLYLSHTGIGPSSFGPFENLGWELVVTKVLQSAEEEPLHDHWEETLLEVLRYPSNYSDEPLQWCWSDTGELADLAALQPDFDVSTRFLLAAAVQVRPDGVQRLCFNLYDDGSYRFTLEERIEEGDLSAWVPREWSSQHPDLASAEAAARMRFAWLS